MPSIDSKSSLKGGERAPVLAEWECPCGDPEGRPDVGERYLEWQAGVLRAERPAVRAICRSGDCGSEYIA